MTNQDQKNTNQANQNPNKTGQKPDVVTEPKSADREQSTAQGANKDNRDDTSTKA